MIDKDAPVICGWCDKESTAQEWEDLTYSYCNTREKRRAYLPVLNEKAFASKDKHWYVCPKCGLWMAGCHLSTTILRDGKAHKIGGVCVIKILPENTEPHI